MYCLAHVVVRVAISSSAELDEAEQLLLGQSLAWGYTVQPPLYTWLQLLFFAIFGVNVLSLVLLKNLLLFSTYLFLFLSARRMMGDDRLASLAALSLWLIPQIVWESQRDLSHSVLVTALASATFYVLLRLMETPSTAGYTALGLLVGLGVLSKASFLVFVAGLLVAAVSGQSTRWRILDRRMGLTLILALVVMLPHLVWLIRHLESLGPSGARGDRWGLGSLVVATISFLTPMWIIVLLIFPGVAGTQRCASEARAEHRRLLERFFAAVLAILVVAIIVLGVTELKDRWMQPFLFVVPLYMFLRIREIDLAPWRLRLFVAVLAFAAVGSVLARAGQVWIGPRFGIYSRLHLPFATLAGQIRAAGFREGTIVAENHLIGGNLRLMFPESRIVAPRFSGAERRPGDQAAPCLVVWNAPPAESAPGAGPRRGWTVPQPSGSEPLPVRYAEAKLIGSNDRSYRLGLRLVSSSSPECAAGSGVAPPAGDDGA